MSPVSASPKRLNGILTLKRKTQKMDGFLDVHPKDVAKQLTLIVCAIKDITELTIAGPGNDEICEPERFYGQMER